MTNEEVWARTGFTNIVLEVKRRRWTWLGHALRMKETRHPLEALSWAPPGERRQTSWDLEEDSGRRDERSGQNLE